MPGTSWREGKPSCCSATPLKRISRNALAGAIREVAHQAFDKAKYEKAMECLAKHRDELLAFYDFPAEHWQHIRTSNPI